MIRPPAFQFYTGDWRKDPGVQALDHEHKGVWIDLLCIMHDSPTRGRLALPSGAPMPDDAIARNLGIPEAKWKQMRSTLLSYGVASEDSSGVLFNRRMVRDENIRLARAEAGRKGGAVSRPPSKKSEAKPKRTRKQRASKTEANTKAKRGSSVSVAVSSSTSVSTDLSPNGSKSEPQANGSGCVGEVERVGADKILEAWIELQPSRPAQADITKQSGVAKRLSETRTRDQLARAWTGMPHLFPHSNGEPWDLFDLEKKFAKAMAAAEEHPVIKGAKRQAELLESLGEQ